MAKTKRATKAKTTAATEPEREPGRSRKGYVMVELKEEFRERFDWLLDDERRRTGGRPGQAPLIRTLIWQEYDRRRRGDGVVTEPRVLPS